MREEKREIEKEREGGIDRQTMREEEEEEERVREKKRQRE